jgi:hypothetical protein
VTRASPDVATPPVKEISPELHPGRPARAKLSTAQMSSLLSTEAQLMVARAQLNPSPIEEELSAWARDAQSSIERLGPRPRGDVSITRWKEFLRDFWLFVEQGWAARAYALDWTDLEILGCDSSTPWSRYDHQGLVFLIRGGRVVALDAKAAVIETEGGALQMFRRTHLDRSRVVLITDIEIRS